MDNAITALRNKYAEDLEDILTCPVCFERLTKRIPVCLQGHHVCSKCCVQMNTCPVCKEMFSGTRNYLAESLLVKFDEIKSSLIDPRHDLNQSDLQNKTCVATQTEIATETDNSINNNNQPGLITKCSNTGITYLFKEGPPLGKGKYPCRIGSCPEEFPHGRMIPHLRYYHKEHIVEEKMVTGASYTNSWEIEYKLNDRFDKAINIPNMGLFFLNITIDNEGHLRGILQIANTTLVSHQFTYEIAVNHSHNTTSYKGNVIACRSAQAKLCDKSLSVANSFMKILLKKKKFFTCNLEITRHQESGLKKGSRGSTYEYSTPKYLQ